MLVSKTRDVRLSLALRRVLVDELGMFSMLSCSNWECISCPLVSWLLVVGPGVNGI